MENEKPRFVFWRPECLDVEELAIPITLNHHLERLNHIHSADVPCIIFAPAGIGVSCGKIALANHETAIMFIVSHKPESKLNDKILFDLSELIIERPEKLEMMIVKSPAILINSIDNLMKDDCSVMRIIAQEHFDCDTFIDLNLAETKPQRLLKPLNNVFNSRSRQNIKHFIRKK